MPAVITTTMRGGVFSMDGVHPGNIGHTVLSYEMAKTMIEIAKNRPNKTFGGRTDEEWLDIIDLLERRGIPVVYPTDEVIKFRDKK